MKLLYFVQSKIDNPIFFLMWLEAFFLLFNTLIGTMPKQNFRFVFGNPHPTYFKHGSKW